jgi:putative ABC transport system permease protein
MDGLVRDLRFAGRMLVREPGFTLLAVLALALGIGATTAIFTIVDAVLLRPLPYRNSDRLVVTLHGPTASGPVSPADYVDYRRSARSFERLSAAQAWGATLGGGERPERVSGLQVSADLFDLLGIPALAGRTFVQGEDEPGRDRVVVLSHALWQRRFASDTFVIGRAIPLDGEPYVVIGVMPRGFRFAPFWQTRAEMWVPLSLVRRLDDRGGRSLRLFGRLKDGVTVSEAQAEMAGLTAGLARTYPATNTDLGITVRPLLDKVVSGIRSTLLALLTMVTFVLLIACANVANTLLARASGRQREIAVRTALGAGRARLVRQLLTESVLLAFSGAVVGLLLAIWGIHWLLALLPAGSLPRQQEVSLDIRVFGVAAAAALITGLATGLVPALQLARTSISGAFQDGSKGATEGSARKRMRSLLVTVEVTLALVLLVGAGLMGRTMLKLGAVDPGFRTDHLAVANVSLAGTPHAAPTARDPMFLRVRDRLASLPGVTAVSAINHLPLAGDTWTLGYTIEGRPLPAPGERSAAVYRVVQPGYFGAMELPLLAGRDFTAADSASAPHVAIINKAMADHRWPGESPLGRRIMLPGPSNVRAGITIVGVAANARQSDWTTAPDDEVYLAYAQRAGEFGLTTMTLVLRTNVDPASVAAMIPRELAALERSVPVTDAGTMTDVVADELWRERLTAQLTGMFAAVALALAAIGVYAVVAYSVARRTREIGVRVALGATRGHVVLLTLGEALRPVMMGAVLGVGLAVASARFVDAFLFGVSAIDPLALAGAVLALVLVAVCAAWLPARRASRLDPTVALRSE